MSWPRFLLLALGCVFTFNIIFALLYLLQPGSVDKLPPGSLLYAYFFSVETLATVGYGEMSPASTYGHIIASIEIDLGIILTAILTGILFVRFSRPKPSFRFATHAVIAQGSDCPTLMIRVANGRLSLLTGARAELTVLFSERNAEGGVAKHFHHLELVHNAIPLFPLTWTVMHKITEKSPLASLDQDGLEKKDAQLFLSLIARDAALGAELQDIHSYDRNGILFGRGYVPVVESENGDNPVADLRKLSDTRPDKDVRQGGELT